MNHRDVNKIVLENHGKKIEFSLMEPGAVRIEREESLFIKPLKGNLIEIFQHNTF